MVKDVAQSINLLMRFLFHTCIIIIIISSVVEVPEVREYGKRHEQCLALWVVDILEIDHVVLNIIEAPTAKAHLQEAFHPLLHVPYFISVFIFDREVNLLARAAWKRTA